MGTLPVNNALKSHMVTLGETLKTNALCHELSVGHGTLKTPWGLFERATDGEFQVSFPGAELTLRG